jgi:hypothetical protein
MSQIVPTRTSGNVRFRAAVGGIADVIIADKNLRRTARIT